MTQRVVVGILPESDPKALEERFSQAGIDMSKLRVFTKAAQTAAHDESVITFVHVAEAMNSNDFSDDLTHGTGLMSDSGGTGVPGLSGGPSLSGLHASRSPNYLAGMPIPADQIDNYNDAVENGRIVVIRTLDAGDDPNTVAEKFKAAGLRNVKAF